MNSILHLKYAVEIEKAGSFSKAAENLYMGQPHLSKAIRELEESIGIEIFKRSSKGVVPTEQGKEFLTYAKSIIAQIDEMENLYKKIPTKKQSFDISVPRASDISHMFAEFVKSLELSQNTSIHYRETNSVKAIKNVADSISNLAIVRYQTVYEPYFLSCLKERELLYREIWEFEYLALMSSEHPLSGCKVIDPHELGKYTEIMLGDTTVPSLPIAQVREQAALNEKKKHIAVYERGSQLELLSRIHTTFLLSSPVPKDVLDRFSLVQIPCKISKNKYKDILVYRENYKLSENDELFLIGIDDMVKKTGQ
ncbi:MAG: LysR family transcriptional regulator [Clostridia bacterium]